MVYHNITGVISVAIKNIIGGLGIVLGIFETALGRALLPTFIDLFGK